MLYGLRQVRRGIMRGFGADLRGFVAFCTTNLVTGFFAGIISTMILQSAGAVTMILGTFLGQKIITTAAALSVVLGADVGVSLMAQVLALDVLWIGPLLMLIGFTMLTVWERRKKSQNIVLQVNNELFPYIKKKPIHGYQKLKERGPKHTLISLDLIPNYELESIILSYGEGMQVLKPLSLRDKIKTRSELINTIYKEKIN